MHQPIFLNFLIVNVGTFVYVVLWCSQFSDYQQILPLGERLKKRKEGSRNQAFSFWWIPLVKEKGNVNPTKGGFNKKLKMTESYHLSRECKFKKNEFAIFRQ